MGKASEVNLEKSSKDEFPRQTKVHVNTIQDNHVRLLIKKMLHVLKDDEISF